MKEAMQPENDNKVWRFFSLRWRILILFVALGFITVITISSMSYIGAIRGIQSSAPLRARQLADTLAYSFDVLYDGSDPFLLQRIIEKTASLEDIDTIMVTDIHGEVLAHNRAERIGQVETDDLIQKVLDTDQVYTMIGEDRLLLLRPLHGRAFSSDYLDTSGILWIELNFSKSLIASRNAILLTTFINAVFSALFIGFAFWVSKKFIADRLVKVDRAIQNAQAMLFSNPIEDAMAHNMKDEISNLVTHFNQMMETLDHRIAFEELIASISVEFSNIPAAKQQESTQDILVRLSHYIEADRAYIFEFDSETNTLRNTYEWCPPGIPAQSENQEILLLEKFSWCIEKLVHGQDVNIPEVSKLPAEAENEQKFLEKQGVKAMLAIPLRSENKLSGFLRFDSVLTTRFWNPEEIRLLRMAANIIASAEMRLQTQQELKDQRDFAQLIMNSIGQGVTVNTFDQEQKKGTFDYVNPTFAAMLELPARDLIGKRLEDFVETSELEVLNTAINRRLGDQTNSYQLRLHSRSGRVINTLVTATPRIHKKNVIGSISVFTDLTEMMAAKEALESSQKRMQAFLDAVPDFFFRVHIDGKILDFKAVEEQQLFMQPDMFIGRTLQEILPEDIANNALHLTDLAIETQTPQLFTYELGMDGASHTFEARIVASGDEEVIIVAHDITEHARLEQMKTDFINRASHELRTPLTTSLLMAELLNDFFDHKSDEENAEYWKILKSQLDRQRELLEDLLVFGRIENEHYQAEEIETDLLKLLQNTITGIAPQFNAKEITFRFKAPDALPAITASIELLKRSFTNLLSNAVKFSEHGGEVGITTEIDGKYIRIDVWDHGIGIPAQDLPLVTGRFFRASNAIKNEVQGSGIGLHMVKKIIEDMGGIFKITSVENDGTTVSLYLPIMPDA